MFPFSRSGRSRTRGARGAALTIDGSAPLRRARRALEGLDRAPAGPDGQAQAVERLLPRLAESRREHDADGGAEHTSESSTPSLPHATTISAALPLEHKGAAGHADADRVPLGK